MSGKPSSPNGGEVAMDAECDTDVQTDGSSDDSPGSITQPISNQPISDRPRYAIQRPDIQLFALIFAIVIGGSALVRHLVEPDHPPLPPELHGSTGFSLDVNAATVEELSLLPNVGPKLAQRIVEERTVHGPFQEISDIKRTPGIGEERFRQMEKMLRVTR